MPDDDSDQHHAVFRQDAVLTMRDVERALAQGHTRKDIKAGGLFCSHGSEMTFCICATKANHFRHVVAPTAPGNGKDAGTGPWNATNGCGCSSRHLDAQTLLRDHDYAKQPVRFTEWLDCLKPACCKTVFDATCETLTVRLEVRENGGKFVSDVVYYDAAAKACMRVEVYATHKADRARRTGTEFVEVAAQHVVESFKKAGNNSSSPITLRCEGSCTGQYEVCQPCVQRKRLAREQADARLREAQHQEAERQRFHAEERQRFHAEERVREEERRRQREADAERRQQEAKEQRHREEELKLHRLALHAEAERARRREVEQKQETERVRIAALDASRAVREAERAEVAASMQVSPIPGFFVTLNTDVPPASQEEIERRRAERMARQQEQQQAKGRHRGRNKRSR